MYTGFIHPQCCYRKGTHMEAVSVQQNASNESAFSQKDSTSDSANQPEGSKGKKMHK